MSYTSFHYSGLNASSSAVSLALHNNGTVAGSEVVQLCTSNTLAWLLRNKQACVDVSQAETLLLCADLSFPAAAGEPPQQLKGFTKVHLEAGASTVVSLALTPRDFSIWSVEKHGWTVVSGTFGVAVGSSSRDHRLVGSVRVP